MSKSYSDLDECDNRIISSPNDVKELMLKQLSNGRVRGTTTYNNLIDNVWSWRKREANIVTGYANEGKSTFLKQLIMCKALKERKKFIFSSPEDFPPEEFFDDMIHTLSGQTTDKIYTDRVISQDLYEKAVNIINDLFLFHYIKPPKGGKNEIKNTIPQTLNDFTKICEKDPDILGVVIDPLLKFSRPKGYEDMRDDLYAAYIGSLCVDFSRQTDTCLFLVMHQTTPNIGEDKKYPQPNMYRIKGGGSWADGFDNILDVWRPEYALDKISPNVKFSSQKIRKQKLVGVPGSVDMVFDRKSNRFKDLNGEDIFPFDEIFYGRKNKKVFI